MCSAVTAECTGTKQNISSISYIWKSTVPALCLCKQNKRLCKIFGIVLFKCGTVRCQETIFNSLQDNYTVLIWPYTSNLNCHTPAARQKKTFLVICVQDSAEAGCPFQESMKKENKYISSPPDCQIMKISLGMLPCNLALK